MDNNCISSKEMNTSIRPFSKLTSFDTKGIASFKGFNL